MEEEVFISVHGLTLEGRLVPGTSAGGAVIAHPHPLYGGSMDNNVVWTAHQAFVARGWSTLRFNFRGVGRSTGTYGEGLAEVADVAAALSFLRQRCSGPYVIAGYSFGAAVAARAMLSGLDADGLILVSPPIALMDMDFLPRVPRVLLVVAGDADSLCPLDRLQAALKARHAAVELAVISGTDHFYGGREEQLFRLLRDHPLKLLATG